MEGGAIRRARRRDPVNRLGNLRKEPIRLGPMEGGAIRRARRRERRPSALGRWRAARVSGRVHAAGAWISLHRELGGARPGNRGLSRANQPNGVRTTRRLRPSDCKAA